jgi:hypothetical protein
MFTPVTWLLSLPLSLWPTMYLHTVPSVTLMHELADAHELHPALRAAGVMDAVATVLYEELEPSQKLEGAESGVDDVPANPRIKSTEKRGAAASGDRSFSASPWNQVGQWLDEQRLVPSRVTVEQLAALARLLCALQRSSSSSPSSSSAAAAAAGVSSSPSSSSPPSSSSFPSEQSLAIVVRALCALVVEAPRMGPVEEQQTRLAVAEWAAIELAHMLHDEEDKGELLSHHSSEPQESLESELAGSAAAEAGREAAEATASSFSPSVLVRRVLRAVLSETRDAWIPQGSGSAVILESGASAVRRRWLRRLHPLTAGSGSGKDGNASASAAASVQQELDLPSLSPAGMAALDQVCDAFRRAGQELGEQYAAERASGRLGAPGSPQFFRSLSMPGSVRGKPQ